MIRLHCNYELTQHDLVKGIEFAPKIYSYLSRNISTKMVEQELSNQGSFEFEIPVSGDGQTPFIRASDMLHLWLFVGVKNEAGEMTANEAGCNALYLSDLINREKPVEKNMELVIWPAYDRSTNSYPSKACLKLTVQTVDLSACPQPFLPVGEFDLVDQNRDKLIGYLSDFLQRASVVYSKFDSTYDSTKYLHLPLFQWCKFQLPGQTFACVRSDENCSETWWKQAAGIALRSHYTEAKSVSEARDRFLKETDPNVTMTVYAKMIGGTVNRVSTYLADGVFTNGKTVPVDKAYGIGSSSRGVVTPKFKSIKPVNYSLSLVGRSSSRSVAISNSSSTPSYLNIEAFSVGRLRWARDPKYGIQGTGDCEDVTCEAGLLDAEFRTRDDLTDPVLLKLHSIRQHYVFGQSLAGVRGAQLSDAAKAKTTDQEHADLGGHLFGLLMPVRDFLDMHSRYNKANPAFEGLNKRMGPIGLKTMWVENTGLMEPSGDPNYLKCGNHLYYLVHNSGNTFSRCKIMQLTSRNQPNPFIKVINSLAFTDLADKYGTIEHMMLSSEKGKWTIGADFLDVVNSRGNVSSYAMPEFTDQEIQTVKSILGHRMPIPAYPDPVSSVDSHQEDPYLESVKRYTEGLKRRPTGVTRKVDVVVLYPNVTADYAKQLQHHIQSRPGIVGFEYFDDNLGPGIGAFTQRFEISIAEGPGISASVRTELLDDEGLPVEARPRVLLPYLWETMLTTQNTTIFAQLLDQKFVMMRDRLKGRKRDPQAGPSTPKQYTVFVPSNNAQNFNSFIKLFGLNPEKARYYVENHVVGSLIADKDFDGNTVVSLRGPSYTLTMGGRPMNKPSVRDTFGNVANVIQTIRARNGTIYVIDRVLGSNVWLKV